MSLIPKQSVVGLKSESDPVLTVMQSSTADMTYRLLIFVMREWGRKIRFANRRTADRVWQPWIEGILPWNPLHHVKVSTNLLSMSIGDEAKIDVLLRQGMYSSTSDHISLDPWSGNVCYSGEGATLLHCTIRANKFLPTPHF